MEPGVIQHDPILTEMVRRLVDAFHPDLVYLYGSRARGDATADSDYDLMVVVRYSDLPFEERWQKAFRLLCGMGVPKDVVVLTRDEVRAWLERVVDDLRACEVDLATDPPIIGDALFHCQQAAEKAMKAFLTAHDVIFPKTHELDVLADRCERVDPSLRVALSPARSLTLYAWAFRYPGGSFTPAPSAVHERLEIARTVYAAITERLPPEALP
jgi:HEPN domain-containing protein/predicted nucleotidyltransferase